MKKIFPLLMLLFFQTARAQMITARVIDALNNKPLSYAIVLFSHEQRITYTDLNGFFSLSKDSLPKNDSIIIQFIGYQRLKVVASELRNNEVYKLTPEMQSLEPVIVSNCRNTQDYLLNKKTGRIRQYIGPGPETRLIIIARYDNISGVRGYVNQITVLINENVSQMQVPMRLHWYEWNAEQHIPGKELTDTNILVYPYTKGWNNFEIPAYTIPAPKDWIVFGLEFIYTPEYKQHYDSLKIQQEKLKWLNDMQNRWSLGMQYVKKEDESGFYMINNGEVTPYSRKYDRYFIRPAIKFRITACKD